MGTLISSCKKDENSNLNKIEFDGNEYELSTGYLEYYGIEYNEPQTHNFKILLVSNGVSVNYELGVQTGTGNAIYLEVYSTSSTELTPGIYNYDETASHNANTFPWLGLRLNYDFSSIKSSVDAEITDGTLLVEKSGNNYKLTFEGTLSGEKPFSAYFEGSLEFHNMYLGK